MANQLGTMTAAAVLNAKQFTAGLDKVKADANKTKAAVDGTFGRNISLIGGLVGFDKLKGLFFQSVARLNQEIAAQQSAGNPLTQLQADFQAAENMFIRMVGSFDDWTAKMVIGFAKIKEFLDQEFQFGRGRTTISAGAMGLGAALAGMNASPSGGAAIGQAALTAQEQSQRRQVQRVDEQRRFQEEFGAGLGRITAEELTGALGVLSQSRVGFDATELAQRALQNAQARGATIQALIREHAALESDASARLRLTLAEQGATEGQMKLAEAIRRSNAEISQAQRHAEQDANRSLSLSDQAISPLERFRMAIADINDAFGLDDIQRARLAEQALQGLFSTIGESGPIGSLSAGSREAAEIMANANREDRTDIVGALRAIEDANARRDQQAMAQRERLIRALEGEPANLGGAP